MNNCSYVVLNKYNFFQKNHLGLKKEICRKLFITVFALFTFLSSHSQGFFSTGPFSNAPYGANPLDLFGWGENFNRNVDVRPSPHPIYGTMTINYHTGLTFSAHSVYGGIRFYNQGYPNAYDPGTGAKMVMSITNGNVGVGTTDPSDLLEIDGGSARRGITMTGQGDSYVYNDFSFAINDETQISIGKPAGWMISHRKDGYFSDSDLGSSSLEFYSSNKGGGYFAPLSFKSNGDLVLVSNKNAVSGNVSIGTIDSKGYKLAVNGKAIAESVTVKLQGNWPDYVFKPSYKLSDLKEIQAYIDQNHHLPEMPSEKEVAEKGLNLGEMNKLLTKKVEELTLYLLEKEKQIQQQQKRGDDQQKQIDRLSKSLNDLQQRFN